MWGLSYVATSTRQVWGLHRRLLVSKLLPGASSPKVTPSPLFPQHRLPSHGLQMTNQNICFHSESCLGNNTSGESNSSPSPLSSSALSPSWAAIHHFKGSSTMSWCSGQMWPGDPCRHAAGHHRETEQARTRAVSRYLHVGLLRVHQLLDDFPEAICIREVASQRPRRWVPSPPRPFHAVTLRVVETPTQHGDLLCTLRDGETWKITYRTCSIIISQCLIYPCPAPSQQPHRGKNQGQVVSVVSNEYGCHLR